MIFFVWISFFCNDIIIIHVDSDQRVAEKPDSGEVRVEMERVKKWVKMLRSWDSSATRDKLRKRVYKGVPDSLRGQAWSKMLNLSTVREEQTGKYQACLIYILILYIYETNIVFVTN